MEYMGARLLQEAGIACPPGTVLRRGGDPAEMKAALEAMDYPCMLKAQVQTGGRGKAGGILQADSAAQAGEQLDRLFDMTIGHYPVQTVYAAPRVDIAQEFYLGVALDRDRRCPVLIFSRSGGVDIEEAAARDPASVQKVEIDPLAGLQRFHVTHVASRTGLDPALWAPLGEVAGRLYGLFRARDALLVEINPLVRTAEGGLMALDAKVVVDDSALPRQEAVRAFREELDEDPLTLEARRYRLLYIPIEKGGRAAVMSNGSGMIMSCIDLLSRRSTRVGAALDLGGGATSDRVAEGIGVVFRNPDIAVLFINIFGGITRCDEIAGGIAGALERLDGSRELVVRMEGTNREEGLEILRRCADRVALVDNIREGVEATAKRTSAI
jgi:succinyl-CoA synthetase beta subunit